MKTLLWPALLVLTLAACRQQGQDETAVTTADETTTGLPADPGTLPVLTFEQPEADLGTVKEGDTLRHRFVFRNSGKTPLLISSASASCGCTVPTFPTRPIAPGDTASLLVAFNSRNRLGPNTKTVTVYANTRPDMTAVQFKVTVVE